MSALIPIPADEKAKHAQQTSLPTLLASLATSVALVTASFAIFVAMCQFKRFKIILQPRLFSHLNTITTNLVLNPKHIFRQIIKEKSETILHDCGMEAVLFDRYLRFLGWLFGSSTLLVTPSLAAFNFFVGARDQEHDFLQRITWANLSPSHAVHYWLYALCVPVYVAWLLFTLTREIKGAINLRKSYQQGANARNHYFVGISELTSQMRNEERFWTQHNSWRNRIVALSFIPPRNQTDEILAEWKNLIRHIERRETVFLRRLVIQMQKLEKACADEFRRKLAQRYGKSNSTREVLHIGKRIMVRWLPYRLQPIDRLYLLLRDKAESYYCALERVQEGVAVIITLRHYHDARALAALYPNVEAMNTRAHYLGYDADHIAKSYIADRFIFTQTRHGIIDLLIVILIILWTIPIGAGGFAARLSSLLYLLNGSTLHLPVGLIGAVQGVLPPLAAYLAMTSMLLVLRLLIRFKHHVTAIETEKSMQKFYFWFLFTQLFGTTSVLSGLIPALVNVAGKGILQLPRILAQNLPLASNYYLSFIAMDTASQAVSMLARVPTLFSFYTSNRFETPKDQIDALYGLHSQLRWGELYSIYSTIAVIVIIYALLSPLILPLSAILFGLARVCSQYTMLYTAYIPTDTNGDLYFTAILQLFWGIITMELTFLGLFVLKFGSGSLLQDLTQVIILLLTIIGTIGYRKYLFRYFQPVIEHDPDHPQEPVLSANILRQTLPDVREKFGLRSQGEIRVRDSNLELAIWLPQDSLGASDALLAWVKAKFFPIGHQQSLTNRYAQIDHDGNVTIQAGSGKISGNGGNGTV